VPHLQVEKKPFSFLVVIQEVMFHLWQINMKMVA